MALPKVPTPLFNSTLMLPLLEFATARSGRLSPVKSAATTPIRRRAGRVSNRSGEASAAIATQTLTLPRSIGTRQISRPSPLNPQPPHHKVKEEAVVDALKFVAAANRQAPRVFTRQQQHTKSKTPSLTRRRNDPIKAPSSTKEC
jgi:hypothetical protein